MIVKPVRHVLAMADLTDDEAAELGPLLRLTAQVARALVDADQVYVCLWSHADAVPGHIHYVVQPVTSAQVTAAGAYGPTLQMQMFRHGRAPEYNDVEALAPEAKALFKSLAGAAAAGAD